MTKIEGLIQPISAMDFVIQFAFMGTMCGTAHSMSSWGRDSGYEEWQIVGGWTLAGTAFALLLQVASLLA